MKKLLSLLFVLSAFSVVGCQKEAVTYKKVDSVDEYFTAEKVEAAQNNLAASEKLSMKFVQSYTGMDYVWKCEIDKDYYFEDSKQIIQTAQESSTSIYKALYLGEETIDNCKLYIIDEDHQELRQDELAVNFYNSEKQSVRNRIAKSVGRPTWLIEEIVPLKLEDIEFKYYIGSDKTIKITGVNDEIKLDATVIVEIDTLIVKKASVKYNAAVSETLTLRISTSMYNSLKCGKHKTLKEIGWKE